QQPVGAEVAAHREQSVRAGQCFMGRREVQAVWIQPPQFGHSKSCAVRISSLNGLSRSIVKLLSQIKIVPAVRGTQPIFSGQSIRCSQNLYNTWLSHDGNQSVEGYPIPQRPA